MEEKKYREVSFKNTYHNLHPLEKRIDFKNIKSHFNEMNFSFPKETSHGFTDRPLKSEPDQEINIPSSLRPDNNHIENELEVHSAEY